MTEDVVFIRDYTQQDEGLILDFVDFIQQKYPQSTAKNVPEYLQNYVENVLNKGGKIFIFEDEEDFAGFLLFTETSERTANIQAVYFIDVYEADFEFVKQSFEIVLDDLIDREFKEIVLLANSFTEGILLTIQRLRFKHDTENNTWIRRF